MAGKAPYRPAGASQKQSLHIRHEAPRKLFVQERVGDSLLLAGLPPAQKGAAASSVRRTAPFSCFWKCFGVMIFWLMQESTKRSA